MIIPADFLSFFTMCIRHKICLPHPFVTLFVLVLLPSLSIRPFTPIRINLYPSICTHSHHFWTTLQKHDVRGNLPDHRTQILTCVTLNAPPLSCFRVPRVSWTPTHASTPIYTHSHPFKPVYTLSLYVYMCNLIKKYYQSNIIIQNFNLVTSSYSLKTQKYM